MALTRAEEIKAKGKEAGFAEGHEAGFLEGTRQMTLWLLEQQFDDLLSRIRERLSGIEDPERLQALAIRLLNWKSLDELDPPLNS